MPWSKQLNYLSKVLKVLKDSQVPVVGIDPSLTLCFEDEYQQVLGKDFQGVNPVRLFDEWLCAYLPKIPRRTSQNLPPFVMFNHCSEKALKPKSPENWQQIFKHFGLDLEVVSTGCCGMAGSFGHEKQHAKDSEALFKANWQPKLESIVSGQGLATGFSCRSQVKRFGGLSLEYPLSKLLGGST